LQLTWSCGILQIATNMTGYCCEITGLVPKTIPPNNFARLSRPKPEEPNIRRDINGH